MRRSINAASSQGPPPASALLLFFLDIDLVLIFLSRVDSLIGHRYRALAGCGLDASREGDHCADERGRILGDATQGQSCWCAVLFTRSANAEATRP